MARWSGREHRLALGPEVDLYLRAGADVRASAGGLVVERPGSGGRLLLHFRTPVIALSVDVDPGTAAGETVQLRHGVMVLDERLLGSGFDVELPGITDVLLPARIERIRSVRFVVERDLPEPVERGAGTPVATLDPPADADEAYALVDLAGGLSTQWSTATTATQLRARYPADRVATLVAHARSTLGDPGNTVLASPAPGQSSASVRVADHLALATLDPVVARMLGLYWVDRDPVDGLYLVRGHMDDAAKTILDGWAFSAGHAAAPRIDGGVRAQQAPGIDYRGTVSTGRATLEWQRPDRRRLVAARPVAVHVVREPDDGPPVSLTATGPRLIPPEGDRCVTDTGVPLGIELRYAVTPVDVFGRAGRRARSGMLRLNDLDGPVAPVRVRATVHQPGLPWSDPGSRDDAGRTAELRATLEYGEAQRRASPDALTVRWLWRAGPRPRPEDPVDTWRELATVPLDPVSEQAVTPHAGPAVSEWPVTVVQVRRISAQDVAAAEARRAPAIRDAAELVTVPEPVVELLLDGALLVPDVLVAHEVVLGGLRADVLASGTGPAGNADTDARAAARVVIPDGDLAAAAGAGATVVLRHAAATGWSAQELRDWLRLGTGPAGYPPALRLRRSAGTGTGTDATTRAVGGEVAVDVAVLLEPDPSGGHATRVVAPGTAGARLRTLVARVAGLRDTGGGDVDLLVSPALDDALLLLLAAATPDVPVTLRHHPPYLTPAVAVDPDGGGDGTGVALGLTAGDRFGTLWISADALDRGGRRSGQVAVAAETRIVRPPPDVTPAAPFPEREGPTAAAGTASPPDAVGVATLTLAWDPLPGPHGAGVRFELARGLDATLVANDHRRWLRGGPDGHHAELGVVAGPVAAATLRAGWTPAPGGRGFVVAVAPGPGADSIAAIGTGRVRIDHVVDGQTRALHHRLVRVLGGTGTEGTPVSRLLCLPDGAVDAAALGDVPEAAAVRVDGPPDYAAVRGDVTALRALADLDPGAADGGQQAFSLVTGTPVAGHRFVDRLPGGTNTVLYKIRAVFPGEIRSAWSPASVGCTVPSLERPPPPRHEHAGRDGDATVHRIELPGVADVAGVRLLRAPAGEPAQDWRDPSLVAARIAATRGLLDLRGRMPAGRTAADLTGVFLVDVDRAVPPAGRGLLAGDPAREVARLLPDPGGRALALRVGGTGAAVTWVDHVPGRHELVVDDADAAGHDVWMQTLRRVELGERVVELRSEPVRLSHPGGRA